MKYSEIEKRAVGLASIFVCAAFIMLTLFLLVKYGLAVFLPFLIAWTIALAVAPLSEKLSAGRKRTKKILSVLLFTLIAALVILTFSFILGRLVDEFAHLLESLNDDSAEITKIVGRAFDFFDDMTSRIPFAERLGGTDAQSTMREKLDSLVSQTVSSAAVKLAALIPKLIAGIMKGLPSLLLFILVTFVSGFYFCADLDGIYARIKSALPHSVAVRLSPVKRRMAVMALKYIRAYLLIFVMTFAELAVGFCVLGVDYALIIALVTALVDVLPVFGVGSVLIPWSILLLISGNRYMGIGLLVIYACITIVRQICEPKIVGESIGLHPLVTLVSMYAGFKLIGIGGMMLGPALALAISGIVGATRRKNA